MSIISLTTIPSRVGQVRATLESLVAQGLPVYLWLPISVDRLGQGFDKVPDWITEMGVKASVIVDFGPASKLLPALTLKEAEIILTADDDQIYDTGWAEGLLNWSRELPDSALCYRGRRLAKGDNRYSYKDTKLILRPTEPVPVDLLTGVHGCLYHRKFFNVDIAEVVALWPRNDDLAFSAYLRHRKIPIMVIPRTCRIVATEAESITPLSEANTGKEPLNNKGLRLLFNDFNS